MLESQTSRNLITENAARSLQNDYSEFSDYETVHNFFEKQRSGASIRIFRESGLLRISSQASAIFTLSHFALKSANR
jgi:hypothetical protein